jgi:MoxR-like ATPase
MWLKRIATQNSALLDETANERSLEEALRDRMRIATTMQRPHWDKRREFVSLKE